MFKRISYEEWHGMVPVIAFILTFGVFVFFVVRALRLQREEVNRLASLPLDLDDAKRGEVRDA
ncbi:MAG: hypothetical protein ACR2RV_10705 [Verrucomicrobiales bacterium]